MDKKLLRKMCCKMQDVEKLNDILSDDRNILELDLSYKYENKQLSYDCRKDLFNGLKYIREKYQEELDEYEILSVEPK